MLVAFFTAGAQHDLCCLASVKHISGTHYIHLVINNSIMQIFLTSCRPRNANGVSRQNREMLHGNNNDSSHGGYIQLSEDKHGVTKSSIRVQNNESLLGTVV